MHSKTVDDLPVVQYPTRPLRNSAALAALKPLYVGFGEKVNKRHQRSTRAIIIAKTALYIVRPNGEISRCLTIPQISSVCVGGPWIGLRVPTEYDSLIRMTADAQLVVDMVCFLFRQLTGEALPVTETTDELVPTKYRLERQRQKSYHLRPDDEALLEAEKRLQRSKQQEEIHKAELLDQEAQISRGVVALFPFQRTHPDELAFAAGDEIHDVHGSGVTGIQGWWIGTNSASRRRGLFPALYVRPL
eukprot:TRINITY_DN97514_c0_g1_i1.p1 TRINITY_DN97514_c0_g1~~TRINITY_DN97514_c0_g1_i1.p1  ORF type:complete len:263 (+),score=46.98 TRINITY_DN97514_c0_g1_i1:52-789(+)